MRRRGWHGKPRPKRKTKSSKTKAQREERNAKEQRRVARVAREFQHLQNALGYVEGGARSKSPTKVQILNATIAYVQDLEAELEYCRAHLSAQPALAQHASQDGSDMVRRFLAGL